MSCNMHVASMENVPNPCMLHETCVLHACRYKWNLHITCAKVSACHYLKYACNMHVCYMHNISYRVEIFSCWCVYFSLVLIWEGVNLGGLSSYRVSSPISSLVGYTGMAFFKVSQLFEDVRSKVMLLCFNWKLTNVNVMKICSMYNGIVNPTTTPPPPPPPPPFCMLVALGKIGDHTKFYLSSEVL